MKRLARSVALLSSLALSLILASVVLAQEDADGKDHPLLSRLPQYWITSYSKNFDAARIPVAADKMQTLEGEKTDITYDVKDGKNPASDLQIIRNYENAVKKFGGRSVFQGEYAGEGEFESFNVWTGTFSKGGKEYWVVAAPYNQGASYRLVVLEKGGMEQEVKTGDLMDKLEREGKATLYINFDTAKAVVKPESMPIIDQIAETLKKNPGLKLRIEGHTDNQGTPESNKALSEKRAKAVLDAVVAKGADKARLSAAGVGQDEPIADNAAEEGRAKNRRVELIKR